MASFRPQAPGEEVGRRGQCRRQEGHPWHRLVASVRGCPLTSRLSDPALTWLLGILNFQKDLLRQAPSSSRVRSTARNRTVGGPRPAGCGRHLCTFLTERWDVKARAGGRGRVQTLLLTPAEPTQSPRPPSLCFTPHPGSCPRGRRHQTGHRRAMQSSPLRSAAVCVAGATQNLIPKTALQDGRFPPPFYR